jgi:C-terminal processing protease CtpA/Prc
MKIIAKVITCLFLLVGAAWAANSSLQFGGVGIDGVARADGTIVVRQLVQGGPADLAGIHAGDVITQIDGTATTGSNFRDMVEHHLRGRAGTPVVLKVRRPGNAKPLTFKLVRRQMTLPQKKK